jgi:pimeloyl-ACP methyl ester carboxylesterase
MDGEIEVDGATLRTTDDGVGIPVLLLHAGGERRTVWEPVAATLRSHGCRTVAVDQRGHGESTGARSDGLPAFAGDVRALVRRFETPPVVVGASLGGMATVLAMADGELDGRVRGVALIDVVPAPDPGRARRYLAGSSTARTGDMSTSPIAEDILAHANALEAAAKQLRVPTVLVRGTESPVTLDSDVQRFLDLVPHASVRPVEGAGHLIAREDPGALAGVLFDFLETLRDDDDVRPGRT